MRSASFFSAIALAMSTTTTETTIQNNCDFSAWYAPIDRTPLT
jgi:hypothetical protein